MPVNAVAFDKKMRGGAQAHLLRADETRPDGEPIWYVTKFVENPQHRRILVNEWISSTLLQYLQISCPKVAVVQLTREFVLHESANVYLQLGSHRQEVKAGWHFGSQFPGDPARLAVYDYLPDTLLDQVYNARDFLGVLLFDKWTGNADARQAIFFRSRIRDWLDDPSIATMQKGFVAQMVDHGYVFGGPQWSFVDAPLQGLYYRHRVYRNVTGWRDFEPWLGRIETLPESILDEAYRKVPRDWLADDEEELEKLLARLYQRRASVRRLIEDCATFGQSPFPNWKP